MKTISIGQLAERSGVSAPTIRYYEQVRLMSPPARKPSGHRAYGLKDESRLTFIRRCRAFGFSIEEVRRLMTLTQSTDRSCFDARDLAFEHLVTLRATLAELQGLEKSLQEFIKDCETRCAGGSGEACLILSELGRTRATTDNHLSNPVECGTGDRATK